jgi:signal transduction histidine kinase
LLLHVAAGLCFAALSLAGMVATFAVEVRLDRGAWSWPTPPAVLVWRGIMALLVFSALCSVGHAIAFARRLRDEAARAARAETLRAEARLAALRAQLNPHFILNLLHSLMGMVVRDPRTAAAALERLGGLLRQGLRVQRQDGEEVPLREELALVADYLALERLRLGDRLRVSVAADPDALDAAVPAFVLQPLVENAIRHAVAPRASGGTVSVTARRDTGALRLRVEDDGSSAGAPATEGEGLGLRLIGERLAALYGDAAWLRAGPAPAGGFVAEVALPGRALADHEVPESGLTVPGAVDLGAAEHQTPGGGGDPEATVEGADPTAGGRAAVAEGAP